MASRTETLTSYSVAQDRLCTWSSLSSTVSGAGSALHAVVDGIRGEPENFVESTGVGGERIGKDWTERGDQADEKLVEDGIGFGLSMFQISAQALFGLEDAVGEAGRRLRRR
jgi:hypothetical protein